MKQRGQAPEADPRARYYIWVTCSSCGDVRVAGECTTLFRDTLAYPCPRCGRRATVPVPVDQHARLVARGFPVVALGTPKELTEPRPGGPPLNADDLLDAHELLAATDDIVRFLRP